MDVRARPIADALHLRLGRPGGGARSGWPSVRRVRREVHLQKGDRPHAVPRRRLPRRARTRRGSCGASPRPRFKMASTTSLRSPSTAAGRVYVAWSRLLRPTYETTGAELERRRRPNLVDAACRRPEARRIRNGSVQRAVTPAGRCISQVSTRGLEFGSDAPPMAAGHFTVRQAAPLALNGAANCVRNGKYVFAQQAIRCLGTNPTVTVGARPYLRHLRLALTESDVGRRHRGLRRQAPAAVARAHRPCGDEARGPVLAHLGRRCADRRALGLLLRHDRRLRAQAGVVPVFALAGRQALGAAGTRRAAVRRCVRALGGCDPGRFRRRDRVRWVHGGRRRGRRRSPDVDRCARREPPGPGDLHRPRFFGLALGCGRA